MKMFVLEGLKGSGKTTAQKLVWQKLAALNPERAERELHYFQAWETDFGNKIRQLLIEQSNNKLTSIQAYLILASRVELIQTLLNPIYKAESRTGRDSIVIMDRWTDSTLANQGMGFSEEAYGILGPGFPWSDPLTFFLDVTPKACAARRQDRSINTFTLNANEETVYLRYQTLANRNNHVIIDGTQSAEKVADQIVQRILKETSWVLK